jgi:hypothetical protein
MSLAAWQAALGRALERGEGQALRLPRTGLRPDERAWLTRIAATRGFAFTADVRRSWCRMRTVRGAPLTLQALPERARRRLVADWLAARGGASSFFASAAVAFLDFAARRLPRRSHAHSLCRFERAAQLAALATLEAAHPRAGRREGAWLERAPYAEVVEFRADPQALIAALHARTRLPRASSSRALLVSPAVPGLWRHAERAELCAWRACRRPARVRDVLAAGHDSATLEALLRDGALLLRRARGVPGPASRKQAHTKQRQRRPGDTQAPV